jgi:ABC-type nitrate/sulfonate/bicarbonate transport system substrate-binding protein
MILPILWLPKPGAAVDKLRIGYGAPTVTMSPLWIAQEGRIFARNDLDVEALYLESALVQRALIAGEVQFGEIPAAKTADPREFVDTRFLEELDRSGYIERLDR